MEIVKLLSEQWLVNWTFIAFITGIFVYIPIVINKHFKEQEKERKDFTSALKDITDKFVSQLNKMNDSNEIFFKELELTNQKHYEKLEMIHLGIKEILNKK